MRYVLALLALIAVAVPGGDAGWGSGGCFASAPMPAVASLPAPVGAYEWHLLDGGPWYSLAFAGSQVGAWNRETGEYQVRQGDGFCPAGEPPVATPEPQPVSFGVDLSKVRHKRYHASGKECDREAIEGILEKGSIPDNSGKRKVVIIGSKDFRGKAVAAVGKPDWAEVTDWDAAAWQVKDAGFATDDRVYVLEPDGAVVHDQQGLDGLEVALRRARPDYDPKKDPDLRKPPTPAPAPAPDEPKKDVPWGAAAIVAAALVAAWSWLKQKGTP